MPCKTNATAHWKKPIVTVSRRTLDSNIRMEPIDSSINCALLRNSEYSDDFECTQLSSSQIRIYSARRLSEYSNSNAEIRMKISRVPICMGRSSIIIHPTFNRDGYRTRGGNSRTVVLRKRHDSARDREDLRYFLYYSACSRTRFTSSSLTRGCPQLPMGLHVEPNAI